MKRIILDTNIYGEMVVDPEINKLKEDFEKCKKVILIYGIRNIIRKELRQTSKDKLIQGKKLRSNLLGLYDMFTAGMRELSITEEHKHLADDYYKVYREFGGSKSKNIMFNDLLIVACASFKEMDIVVSEDEKTMLAENAIKAYKLVNNINNKRTPRFIGYKDFKAELRSCLSNKLIGSSNKLWVFLVFFNFLYQLIKIHFFMSHIIIKSKLIYKLN
jgi:predicted nucleic acid-binding protein